MTHTHCRSCGATGNSLSPPQVCAGCGGELKVIPYIQPAGFAVDIRQRPHTDISMPSYLKPVPPWISAGDAPWVALPDPGLGRHRVARSGHVFHYTRGMSGNGYAVCLHCGHAEEEPHQQPGALWKLMKEHKPLRGTRTGEGDGVCRGTETPYGIKRQLALGYSVHTDVFELQLFGLKNPSAAPSLAVAMREALVRELGVESSEVGWAALPSRAPDGGVCHSVILYDLAAGGAGFASSAAEWAGDLLRSAERVLDCTNPECRTACHACLIVKDTQHDADRLDRQAALAFLREAVSAGVSLPAGFRYFGEGSRAEDRPLIEAIDLALYRHPEAGLRVWLAGDIGEWDLSAWPAGPLLEKWGAKGREIRIVADDTVLKVMTLGQRVTFSRLAERSRAKVLAGRGRRSAPDGKATVVAEISGGLKPPAWAMALPGNGAPNARWGGDGTAPVIVGAALDFADLPEIDLSSFLAPEGDKADLIPILGELDGSVDHFGDRFWDILVERKPEIDQLLAGGGDLLEATYHDRYLFNPLMVRLLYEILQPVTSVSGKSVKLTVETLESKGYPVAGQPSSVEHDWLFMEHRKSVMKAALGALCADTRIEFGNKWELSHDRTLTLLWERGRLVIHLDQGLGHWNARASFNFSARPEQQADNLLTTRFDVRHRGNHPTVMFVRDPQLLPGGCERALG